MPDTRMTEAAPEMKRKRTVNQKVAGGKTCGKAQSSGKRLCLQPAGMPRSEVWGCAPVRRRESNAHGTGLCCGCTRSLLRMERQCRQQRQTEDPSTEPHNHFLRLHGKNTTPSGGETGFTSCAGASVTSVEQFLAYFRSMDFLSRRISIYTRPSRTQRAARKRLIYSCPIFVQPPLTVRR